MGAVGSIFGGISASKAMKQVKENLNERRKRNQDWFDRRYNEDPTQRASAQAIFTRTQDSIRRRNRQAAGVQAVTGGTDESVAAAKDANNSALADAATNIAVSGEARKDAIESQYQQTDNMLQQQIDDMERAKAMNVRQAGEKVANTGTNIAGLL